MREREQGKRVGYMWNHALMNRGWETWGHEGLVDGAMGGPQAIGRCCGRQAL